MLSIQSKNAFGSISPSNSLMLTCTPYSLEACRAQTMRSSHLLGPPLRCTGLYLPRSDLSSIELSVSSPDRWSSSSTMSHCMFRFMVTIILMILAIVCSHNHLSKVLNLLLQSFKHFYRGISTSTTTISSSTPSTSCSHVYKQLKISKKANKEQPQGRNLLWYQVDANRKQEKRGRWSNQHNLTRNEVFFT